MSFGQAWKSRFGVLRVSGDASQAILMMIRDVNAMEYVSFKACGVIKGMLAEEIWSKLDKLLTELPVNWFL